MSRPGKWILISNSLLFVILFIASCSSKNSPEELTKELDTVSSWAATAQMVSEAWIHEAVPTNYAKQTLKTTQKQLQKETDKLSELSMSPKQRRTVLEALEQLKTTVSQISAAVEQKNRSALAKLVADLATQIKQLSTEEQSIRLLAKPLL